MQLPCELPRLTSDGESKHETPTGSWKACLVTLGENCLRSTCVKSGRYLSWTRSPRAWDAAIIGWRRQCSRNGCASRRLATHVGVSPSTTPRYAVVVQHDAHQIGLLIDEVPEIRWMLPEDRLDQSGASQIGERSLLSGLIRVENRVSGMLEIPALVASVEATTMDVSQSIKS